MSQIAEAYGYTGVPSTFTRKQLLRVLKSHSIGVAAFDAEHPLSASYNADEVLAWLAY